MGGAGSAVMMRQHKLYIKKKEIYIHRGWAGLGSHVLRLKKAALHKPAGLLQTPHVPIFLSIRGNEDSGGVQSEVNKTTAWRNAGD